MYVKTFWFEFVCIIETRIRTHRRIYHLFCFVHPFVFSLICLIRSRYQSFQKVSQDYKGKSSRRYYFVD